MRPTSAAGLTSPPLPGTWVIAISFVCGPIVRSSAARSSCPDAFAVDHIDLDPYMRPHL
jgi:hypothetical protein